MVSNTLQEFDLGFIQITDSYYVNVFTKKTEYLLHLDPDKLLAGFKAVAEGKDPLQESDINLYGGWEDSWSLLRGHTLGHYLTAMAQVYKQVLHEKPSLAIRVKKSIDYVVNQLEIYQNANAKRFVFASPETHFDVVEGKCPGHQWAPWYTLHKIIAGLVKVHDYTGNRVALEIASKLGDWCYERTSRWDEDLQRQVLNIEYGGINDALYELYKFTNAPKHLQAANMFDEDELFAQIAKGNNVLENRHANTQIPKFIGALNRYRVLGKEERFYYHAAEKFWEIVVNDHSYITGGNSENEHFREPGQLNACRTNLNNETCNAYNMLLLTRELFKITGDVKYASFYEQAFINEIMASINPETGMTTYFKPMGTGYFKTFGTETESFWCCTGTGMESFTKLNDSIYFYSEQSLYVNMYLSSELKWNNMGFVLIQKADIPNDDQVSFKIETASSNTLEINFRVPDWITHDQQMTLTVNDEIYPAENSKGYLSIMRKWRAGDIVKLRFPIEVQASRLSNNPKRHC